MFNFCFIILVLDSKLFKSGNLPYAFNFEKSCVCNIFLNKCINKVFYILGGDFKAIGFFFFLFIVLSFLFFPFISI